MSLPKEYLQKALLLKENENLNLRIKDTKKLNSFRTALYKAKNEFDTENEISITTKNDLIVITKNKPKEEDFEIEVFISNNNEEDKEYDEEIDLSNKRKPGVQTINLDEKRVKTIREKLSIFDKEKEVLIEKFKSCKIEIESQDDISEEDKQFLIKRSLEIVNNEIEKLNIKAREIAQESRKVKD